MQSIKKFLNAGKNRMNFPSLKALAPLAVLLPMAAMAATPDSTAKDSTLEQRQQTLLQRLTDLENGFPGISINGDLLYRGRTSTASGTELMLNSATYENYQSIEGNLIFTARPTKDSRATVMMRAHQDYQSAYDEGPNPIRLHWWSYDGNTVDGKGFFHLGDVHVKYSPLTMDLAIPKIYGEAPMFARMRQESMFYRHQDTTGRLMQGLDAGWKSNVGPFRNVLAEVTLTRLRNQGKKSDLIFFDNDSVARYMGAARTQWDMNNGIGFGVNFVSVMDRVRNGHNYLKVTSVDSMVYEHGWTGSGEFRLDAAKMLGTPGLILSLNAEVAHSSYQQDTDVVVRKFDGTYTKQNSIWYLPSGTDSVISSYFVPNYALTYELKRGTALAAQAIDLSLNGGWEQKGMKVVGTVNFLMNDSGFTNELAQSPAYLSTNSVLNSGANKNLVTGLDTAAAYVGSSLESMYFTTYTVDPETQRNAISGGVSEGTEASSSALFNNYIRQHYIRNAWTSTTLRSSELSAARKDYDMAAGLVLPEGVATANRVGPMIDLNGRALDNTVGLQVRWASLSEAAGTGLAGAKLKFNDLAFGADVAAGSILGLKQSITATVGFESSDDNSIYARTFTRISGGLDAEILYGFSLSAGYQAVKREETLNSFVTSDGLIRNWGVVTSDESMWLAGLDYKIAEGAHVSVNYGKLATKVSATAGEVNLDRDLFSTQVKVNF